MMRRRQFLQAATAMGAMAGAGRAPARCGEGGSEDELAAYRAELGALRKEITGVRTLPAVAFFLFGMGGRRKLLYRGGTLSDARTGEVVRRWDVAEERIVPSAYRVELRKAGGGAVRVEEDERGVWLDEDGHRTALTEGPVRLPSFAEHRYGRVLRVLHQELLVNVVDGRPVPNLFVYERPWHRDGAMMAMAFQKTGNLDVVRGWIAGLRDPFDRNNGGNAEPDNLGQALYLASLVGDRSQPVVKAVEAALPRFTEAGHLKGKTDFAEHPVYATKWLKFGLSALGMEDTYTIPKVADSYSALFWWGYRGEHVETGGRMESDDYPYLTWADDHFHGRAGWKISDRDYPLTWEAKASQAKYEGMRRVDRAYEEARLCAPHTWHTAEVFLHLLDRAKG